MLKQFYDAHRDAYIFSMYDIERYPDLGREVCQFLATTEGSVLRYFGEEVDTDDDLFILEEV